MTSKIAEQITETIISKLDQGIIPWRQTWGAGADMPRNLVSKKAYRGINVFILNMAAIDRGYKQNLWVTYNQARQLGGFVRKGEKSTHIIFWQWIKKENESGDDNSFALMRDYFVFNVEQCDGLKLPAATEKKEFEPIEQAEQISSSYSQREGITVEFKGSEAWYMPSQDRIQVPAAEQFESSAAFYSTLFHEQGHSTGKSDRLDRPGITGTSFFGSQDYSKEELVAEFTAAILCGICGIENATIENSVAYIQNWSAVLKQDENKKWIISAAAQAQKAADFIQGIEFKKETEE